MSANLPYQVLYFALDAAATVVVVYDLAAKKFVTTATTNVDGTRINIPLTGPAPPVAFIPPSSDTTLGTSVVNATYSSSQKLYNICGSVLYDPLNGYLVMVAADKSLTVYTPSGGAPLLTGIKTPNTIKPPTTRTVSNSDATWMASDAAGGNLVIYVPYMNYTCVGVMCADATNPALLAVRSAVFFDGAPTAKTAQIPAPLAIVTVTGVIDGALFAPASAVTSAPTTGVSGESLDDVIRNYYQSYWYDSANAEGARTSSDFMLKTQMIPPICPACPASCGCGKCASAIDASGAAPQTVDASGNSIYTTGPGLALTPGSNPLPGTKTETDAQKLSAAGEIKAGVTGVYGEAKDVAGDVYGEAKGVVGGVAGDVTGGVKSGVTGVYGEVKDVVGDVAGGVVGGVKGVYGEAKDVVGGVVGGVGNVVGSVAGGVGSAVGGVANGVGNVVGGVLQPPTYLQQQQQQAGGGVATYAGSGSYGGYGYPPTGAPLYVAPQVGGSSRAGAAVGGGAYPPPPTPLGAVPSSPFVPITANFSAFGK
jgi:hypothetical protein